MKTLLVLVLALIILAYNFVFTDEKVGLTDHAKVLQGLSSALSYKTAVIRYWTEKNALPGNTDWVSYNPGVKVDLSQTIVKSIEVGVDGPGVVSVHYSARPGLESPAAIDGKKINLIPGVLNGRLDWSCKGTLEPGLMPKNCGAL